MTNDPNKEEDTETISLTWNRSSKLKKRRRMISPGRNNATLVISTITSTSAGASTSTSINTSTGAKNNTNVKNSKGNDTHDSSVLVPPFPSTFLQLPMLSDKFHEQRSQELQQKRVSHPLGERLAVELEYWMNFKQQEQQQNEKTKETDNHDCDTKMVPFSSYLSFPSSKSKRLDIQHDLSIGSSVSNDHVSFPTRTLKRTSMENPFNNQYGLLRIVSLNGATIRRECDIHDNSSPIIGKLPYQALRCFVEKQWLSPPPDEEFGLVTVLRYKIILMDGDGSKDEDCTIYGWISDRSRLDDDSYVIADCIVDI
jgi:hypothetical protein